MKGGTYSVSFSKIKDWNLEQEEIKIKLPAGCKIIELPKGSGIKVIETPDGILPTKNIDIRPYEDYMIGYVWGWAKGKTKKILLEWEKI